MFPITGEQFPARNGAHKKKRREKQETRWLLDDFCQKSKVGKVSCKNGASLRCCPHCFLRNFWLRGVSVRKDEEFSRMFHARSLPPRPLPLLCALVRWNDEVLWEQEIIYCFNGYDAFWRASRTGFITARQKTQHFGWFGMGIKPN